MKWEHYNKNWQFFEFSSSLKRPALDKWLKQIGIKRSQYLLIMDRNYRCHPNYRRHTIILENAPIAVLFKLNFTDVQGALIPYSDIEHPRKHIPMSIFT